MVKNIIGSWNFGPSKINLSVLKLAKLGKKIFNSNSKIIIDKKKNIKHEAKYLIFEFKKIFKIFEMESSYDTRAFIKINI
jgi:hypothetical protein